MCEPPFSPDCADQCMPRPRPRPWHYAPLLAACNQFLQMPTPPTASLPIWRPRGPTIALPIDGGWQQPHDLLGIPVLICKVPPIVLYASTSAVFLSQYEAYGTPGFIGYNLQRGAITMLHNGQAGIKSGVRSAPYWERKTGEVGVCSAGERGDLA